MIRESTLMFCTSFLIAFLIGFLSSTGIAGTLDPRLVEFLDFDELLVKTGFACPMDELMLEGGE